ncbi:multidrug effflux MFS transporter [Burkholderia sp. MR1-5-21]
MDEPSIRSDPNPNGFRLITILATLAAFAPFSTDMYLAAFPAMAVAFQADAGSVQATLSVFVFGLAAGQLLYGPAIDRYGRKLPLQIGVTLFALASLGLYLAPTIEIFVCLRLLQAIGGCCGMVICRAIISDLFDEREAVDKLSVVMLFGSLAPIVAPIAGGLIVTWLHWRAVFLFLAAFGLLCLVALSVLLPETLPPHRRSTGVFRNAAVVSTRLLGSRAFVLPMLSGALGFADLFAFISGSPSVFMSFFGIDRSMYGWVFASVVVGMMAFSQCSRLLLRSVSSEMVFVVSMSANVLGALVLVLCAGHVSVLVFVLFLIVALSGIPLAAATCTSKAMAAADASKGSGSALLGLLQFGFAGIASSVVGHFYDGTPTAMTISMLVLGCLSLAAFCPVL